MRWQESDRNEGRLPHGKPPISFYCTLKKLNSANKKPRPTCRGLIAFLIRGTAGRQGGDAPNSSIVLAAKGQRRHCQPFFRDLSQLSASRASFFSVMTGHLGDSSALSAVNSFHSSGRLSS